MQVWANLSADLISRIADTGAPAATTPTPARPPAARPTGSSARDDAPPRASTTRTPARPGRWPALPWEGDPCCRHLDRLDRRGRRARRRGARRGDERDAPRTRRGDRPAARARARRGIRHARRHHACRRRHGSRALHRACASASPPRGSSRSARGVPLIPVVSHDAAALAVLAARRRRDTRPASASPS